MAETKKDIKGKLFSGDDLYMVHESDLTALGNLFGAYSTIEIACEACKKMLDTVLLYDSYPPDREVLDYEIIELEVRANSSLVVYGSSGSHAIIQLTALNKNNWH